jgi:hypothetical protein
MKAPRYYAHEPWTPAPELNRLDIADAFSRRHAVSVVSRAHLFAWAIEQIRIVRELEQWDTDQRPGDYFVTCRREDGKQVLVSGPYASHRIARMMQSKTSRIAGELDPKAIWYAWGTGRMESNSGRQGALQSWGYDLALTK